MLHTTLLVLTFSGLMALPSLGAANQGATNQGATEMPSGVGSGRMAVTNRAGQSNEVRNDVPRREVAPREGAPRQLQLAQNQSAPRPGTAAQGLGTVYVIPQSVVLRDGLGGRAVTSVTQGTPLTVLADERLQLRVRTPDGQEGFIPKRQVQSAPPATGGRGLGGIVREDRSAAELRTAASMRGLSEESKSMARTEGISEEAIRAAEQFEQFALSITEAEVDVFLTQGGLNP